MPHSGFSRAQAGLQALVPFFDTSRVVYASNWNSSTQSWATTSTASDGHVIYPAAFARLAF